MYLLDGSIVIRFVTGLAGMNDKLEEELSRWEVKFLKMFQRPNISLNFSIECSKDESAIREAERNPKNRIIYKKTIKGR